MHTGWCIAVAGRRYGLALRQPVLDDALQSRFEGFPGDAWRQPLPLVQARAALTFVRPRRAEQFGFDVRLLPIELPQDLQPAGCLRCGRPPGTLGREPFEVCLSAGLWFQIRFLWP